MVSSTTHAASDYAQRAWTWARNRVRIHPAWLGLGALGTAERYWQYHRRNYFLLEAVPISEQINEDPLWRPEIDRVRSAFGNRFFPRFDASSRVVFLCGFGGTGKSSVGKAYAKKNCATVESNHLWGQRGQYTGVIRVDAIKGTSTDKEKIVEEMAAVTKKIKDRLTTPNVEITGRIASLFGWEWASLYSGRQTRAKKLQIPTRWPGGWGRYNDAEVGQNFRDAVNLLTEQGRWLLIFDNVDSPDCQDAFIKILFPNGRNQFHNVDVLISGRYASPNMDRSCGLRGKISMSALNAEEEESFFKKVTPQKEVLPSSPADLTTIFSHTLCYPYFIATAAQYCVLRGSTRPLANALNRGDTLVAIFEKTVPGMDYKKYPNTIYDVYVKDVVNNLDASLNQDMILKLFHTLPYLPAETGTWRIDREALVTALHQAWKEQPEQWRLAVQHLVRHSLIEDNSSDRKALSLHPFACKLIRDVQQGKWDKTPRWKVWSWMKQYNPDTCCQYAKEIARYL